MWSSRLIRRIVVVALPVGTAVVVLAAVVWPRIPPAVLTTGQVLTLLPPGSTLHSLVRVELDGREPLEIAAVATVPRLPQADALTYYEIAFGYDRWRRQLRRVYARPLSQGVPLSVDAIRLTTNRDAAIFTVLDDDGTQSYRIVGASQRAIRVLHEGRVAGRVVVADPLVIEDRHPPVTQGWDGRRFVERPLAAPVPGRRSSLSWRYWVRNSAIVARTSSVFLAPRQTLRLVALGGGPSVVVIPDPRLDLVENGYRARIPGMYTIRLLVPFAPIDQAYTLTVVVEGTQP